MGANGRLYGFNGTIAAAAATKTIAVTTAATAASGIAVLRLYWKDLYISSNATPANNSSEWLLLRCTAAGTSTGVTPTAFDSGDPVANTVCGRTSSVEPTYAGTQLLDIAHNQQATVRWIAGPGEEIIGPATSGNGLGLQCNGVGGSGVAEVVSIVFGE